MQGHPSSAPEVVDPAVLKCVWLLVLAQKLLVNFAEEAREFLSPPPLPQTSDCPPPHLLISVQLPRDCWHALSAVLQQCSSMASSGKGLDAQSQFPGLEVGPVNPQPARALHKASPLVSYSYCVFEVLLKLLPPPPSTPPPPSCDPASVQGKKLWPSELQTAASCFKSSVPVNLPHPDWIGLETLARNRPDDFCTVACFRTGSIWPQTWHSRPEANWIRTCFAQYDLGRL